MQLGFVSAIVPELSLDEVVRLAAEERFDCIELMCWPPGKADRRYAGVTHIDVESLDEVSAREIIDRIGARGVAISGLGYYPNPLSPDAGEAVVATNHLRKVIVAAARLGVGLVNTFIGRDWTRSVAANWPRFLDVWRPLVALAEEHGVRIGIENCPMYFSGDEWPGGKNLAISPAIWRRMFAEIPSASFGLNYDPSHLVWQQMDYLAPLAEFGSRLFHVHAKDVELDRGRLNDVGILATPLEYHRPVLPGMGAIDWAKFMAALAGIGYGGSVCIEVEDRRFEHSLESRKEALQRAAAVLRPLIDRTRHSR
jgi:sugar phosphate isomerase/epimerase